MVKILDVVPRMFTRVWRPRRSPEPERGPRMGKSGELTIAEDMRLGAFLMRKGSYFLSHRLEGNAHVLVLTAVEPAVPSEADGGKVMTTRQLVTRSSVFAEELDDKSFRVRIVQIAGVDG